MAGDVAGSAPSPAVAGGWQRWWPAVVMAVGAGVLATQERAFVRYPPDEAAKVSDPHLYKGRPLCQRCHPGADRRLVRAPDALCLECHEAHEGDHPAGLITQRRPTPLGLPLGPGREVHCHTCHDPHDVRGLPGGLRLPYDELCQRCHLVR